MFHGDWASTVVWILLDIVGQTPSNPISSREMLKLEYNVKKKKIWGKTAAIRSRSGF